MLDLNKDELLSLHNYIFETKFSEDAQDIAFSKHVSQIANKVLDKIISNAEIESPNMALAWKKWRVLSKDRREWGILINKISNDPYLDTFDLNRKINHNTIFSKPL